nr:hypothetical protein 1634Bnrm3_p134 [Cryptomonas sp.]
MIRNILLEGYLQFNPESLKNFVPNLRDVKKIDNIFSFFRKMPFFFLLNTKFFCTQTKIECRWEKFRLKILGISILKNPQLSEVTKKILQEIGKYGKMGILQHKLARLFGLESNDIYHHLIYLLNFNLIQKEVCSTNLNSKFSNSVLLKSNFYLEYKKINDCNEYLEKSINLNTSFSLIENLIKISARIGIIAKQKKIKYGVLSFCEFLNKNDRRKIHRIWRKAREKCYKAKLSSILPTFSLIFHEKYRDFKYTYLTDKKEKKIDNLILEKPEQFSWQFVSLFNISPEVHMWKILLINRNKKITSPVFLDLFRGHISYKAVQFMLKNLEKFKGISKTLEQVGRQKIMHFYCKNKFFPIGENLHCLNNKITKRVTEQVAKRRLALLTWTKDHLVHMKELGKKFADFENKGLKKVDSKVVRRVLSDLINFGYIKIIKIYVQLNATKTKVFEFVVEKNCRDFYPKKISKFSLNLATKNNVICEKFEKIETCLKKKNLNSQKCSFPEISLYFWHLKYTSLFSTNVLNLPLYMITQCFNLKKKTKFNFISVNPEVNIFKNRHFFSNYRYESMNLNFISFFEKRYLKYQSNKRVKKIKYILFKLFSINFYVYQNIIKTEKNIEELFVLRNWNKIYKFQIDTIIGSKEKIIHCKSCQKKEIIFPGKKITHKYRILNKHHISFLWTVAKFPILNIDFKEKKFYTSYENVTAGNIQKYDIFKSKWDCELDTRLYNQFLFNLKIKKNSSKKLKPFQKKHLRRRIKGLSIISNVKVVSIFFKKCLKSKETSFFFNSALYFYQMIKRSLELPNDNFFLNIQKIKIYNNQFKKNSKNPNQRYKKNIFECIIKDVHLKICMIFLKMNFASLLSFFVFNFIFFSEKLIYPETKKNHGSCFNFNKIFETKRREQVGLANFYSNKNFFWQKRCRFYSTLDCERILNILSVKTNIFMDKFDKCKLNLQPFFIKNSFFSDNKKNYFRKKKVRNIHNTIEARIILKNFYFIRYEKYKIFPIENVKKKALFTKVAGFKSIYFDMRSLKKAIFHSTKIFQNLFGISINFRINQISFLTRKLISQAKRLSRLFAISFYLMFWEYYDLFIFTLKENEASLDVMLIKIDWKKKHYMSTKITYIEKYVLFCNSFLAPNIEKSMLFFKTAKFFDSFSSFENTIKLLLNEDRISLFEVYGKTNTICPFMIRKNGHNNSKNYTKVFRIFFFQPKTENLLH